MTAGIDLVSSNLNIVSQTLGQVSVDDSEKISAMIENRIAALNDSLVGMVDQYFKGVLELIQVGDLASPIFNLNKIEEREFSI